MQSWRSIIQFQPYLATSGYHEKTRSQGHRSFCYRFKHTGQIPEQFSVFDCWNEHSSGSVGINISFFCGTTVYVIFKILEFVLGMLSTATELIFRSTAAVIVGKPIATGGQVSQDSDSLKHDLLYPDWAVFYARSLNRRIIGSINR